MTAAPAPNRDNTIHVIQGGHAISDDANAVMATILGSCVATCLRDPVAGVGGMNHFLLPGDSSARGESMKYGVNAMELLINGLLQRGALRTRLEAKIFGGAHVIDVAANIGAQNAAFAERFLKLEGIQLVGASLGGAHARRVRYWPVSGRASQMLVERSDVFKNELAAPARKPPAAPAADIELF